MSCNRENAIWQSADGTWSRAFFAFQVTGADHEWDVEYDLGTFFWASTGHATADGARAAWQGANPCGYRQIPWCEANRVEIERHDLMARESATPGSR